MAEKAILVMNLTVTDFTIAVLMPRKITLPSGKSQSRVAIKILQPGHLNVMRIMYLFISTWNKIIADNYKNTKKKLILIYSKYRTLSLSNQVGLEKNKA